MEGEASKKVTIQSALWPSIPSPSSKGNASTSQPAAAKRPLNIQDIFPRPKAPPKND